MGTPARAVEHRAVAVRGIELAYRLEGTGRALLVVGSSIFYPRTFSSSLRHSFSLVCADLPHFARRSAAADPSRVSFDEYARCIEAVRADAGFDSVIVAGHSHHGNVALEYARCFPDRVSHVVMIGSPPVNVPETIAAAHRYWEEHASAVRKARLDQRRAVANVSGQAGLTEHEAYVARYVADAPLYWNDPDYDAGWLWEGMEFRMEMVDAFRRLYQSYHLRPLPAQSPIPTLVVMGRNDYAVPHTLWESFSKRMKGLTVNLIDESGHTPQLEQPDEFERVLHQWLDRTVTPQRAT